MPFSTIPTSGLWGDIAGLLNDNFDQVSDTKIVLQAESFSAQNPTGTNAPLQIEFGASANVETGEITLAASGAMTVVTAGLYFAQFSMQMGRSSSPGEAVVVTRTLINGVQNGDTSFFRMDDAANNVLFSGSSLLQLTATQVFTIQIARDASGADDGGLSPFTPDAGLTGWNQASSAEIQITKLFTIPA